MELPLVSVVIPCYNHENFVQDCIQSVIDQTYQNIELIIIDDGSSDGSVNKIQEMTELCQNRFTNFEFRHRPNKGLSATLNEAIEWCQGKYYSVIASDDMMLKDKTKKQVAFLEIDIDCVAVCGGVYIIDENSNEISKRVLKSKEFKFDQIIMLEHELPAPTQMIRLAVIKKVGGYDTQLNIEDWYMWLLLANEGKIVYIQELFSKYRNHEYNTFKRISIMHDARVSILKNYENHVLYSKAKNRVMWINACEFTKSSKIVALKKMLSIVYKRPSSIFTYDMFRFFYWLLIKK